MSDMPEIIWAWLNQGTFWTSDPNHRGITSKTEYLKSDSISEMMEAAKKMEWALSIAKRDINNWFMSEEAKQAAIKPIDEALSLWHNANKGEG